MCELCVSARDGEDPERSITSSCKTSVAAPVLPVRPLAVHTARIKPLTPPLLPLYILHGAAMFPHTGAARHHASPGTNPHPEDPGGAAASA